MKKFSPLFAFFFAFFLSAVGPLGRSALLVFAMNALLQPADADEGGPLRTVTCDEMAQAMRRHGNYDVTKTTNAGRFQAETLLHLARSAQEGDPNRRPLFVSHKDWFDVYLDVAGLTAETAPIFAKLAYQHRQDFRIEYRPERVIHNLKAGARPQMTLNVTISWPESPSGPDRYSYDDTLSVPRLQVTDHRVITYRLLDFGDRIVFDDIRGLTGRPTTGLLGLLFRLIGEGALVETRIAISSDGLQVVRGRAKKGFMKVSTTATVYPDGHAVKDLPDGRTDLREIEARLKEPIDVEYIPFP